MFYPDDFANFLKLKSFISKIQFLHYCDVYESGKLGFSVTTSPFMTLVKLAQYSLE